MDPTVMAKNILNVHCRDSHRKSRITFIISNLCRSLNQVTNDPIFIIITFCRMRKFILKEFWNVFQIFCSDLCTSSNSTLIFWTDETSYNPPPLSWLTAFGEDPPKHYIHARGECWCDLRSRALLDQGFVYPTWVIEIHIFGWNEEDPRTKEFLAVNFVVKKILLF